MNIGMTFKSNPRENILKDNKYNFPHSIQTLYKQHHTSFIDNEVINVAMRD